MTIGLTEESWGGGGECMTIGLTEENWGGGGEEVCDCRLD